MVLYVRLQMNTCRRNTAQVVGSNPLPGSAMYTVPNELTEIARFGNWDEFQEAEHKLEQLVKQGRLYGGGLDPLKPASYVQAYRTQDGVVW